jgi:thiol-disulfide isomerase/thioredoxin
VFWRQVLAAESDGDRARRDGGHREHFQLLEEGRSWSGREPDVFFDNLGDGTFAEVASLLGLHSRLDGRGAAAADLDDDGDLDLVVVSRNSPTIRVYRNDAPSQGDVLLVDLGPAADSGAALGAEIEVECGGRRFLRLVSAGSGFLSQAPAVAHFGLGSCDSVGEILVRRRGVSVRIAGPIAANQRVSIRGDRVVSQRPLKPRNWSRGGASVVATAGRVLSLPLPRADFEGSASDLTALAAGTLVINFWATWCTSCAREHDDLLAVASDPAFAEVRFLAVSVDESVTRDDLAPWGDRFLHARTDPAGQSPFSAAVDLAPGAVPLTLVVRRGVIRWAHAGAVDAADLRAALRSVF